MLLGIIDHKIGYIDHLNLKSKWSRMKFSQSGRDLFSKVKGNTIFDEIIDHDLIVKTDRVKKVITKGKNKGKIKMFTKVINYNDSVEIRRKKEFIKKVNRIYDDQKVVVKEKDVIVKNVSFLDELYLYVMNNSITLKELDCEIIDSVKEDSTSTLLRYLDKLNDYSKDIPISIKDNRRVIDKYMDSDSKVSLLIPELEKGNDNIELNPQEKIKYKKGNDLLRINRIHFIINKKKMFRVYSRGSFHFHGRYYGSL